MVGINNSTSQPDLINYMRMLERRLARLERGVSGGPSDDSSVIASLGITGLTLSTQTVTASDDYYKVMMRYSWTPITDDPSEYNKDALDHYLTSWSADGVHFTAEQSVKDTSVDVGPFNQGVSITFRVRARTIKGTLGPYTSTTNSTTTDVTAPFQPSTPFVSPYLGQLAIEWDGLDVSSNPPPTDFRFVEVHLSTTNGSFTPSILTLQGTLLRGGGTWIATDLSYGTTYYAKLVAVDTVGNRSPASSPGVAVPEQVVNGDVGANAIGTLNIQNLAVNNAKISDLSVGKLTVGTLTANMTIGARIMTGSTGARVELNSSGLQAYNSSGTKTVDIAAATGAAIFTGTLKTDFSNSTTPHIEMTPFNNTIWMTSNDGLGTSGNSAFMNGPLDGGNIPQIGINTGIFTYGGVLGRHRLFMANAGGILLETPRQGGSGNLGYAFYMTDTATSIYRTHPANGDATGGTIYMDINGWRLLRTSAGVENGGQIYADPSNLYLSAIASGTNNATIQMQDNGTIWVDGRLASSSGSSNVCLYVGQQVVLAGTGSVIYSYGATLASSPKVQCSVARSGGGITVQVTAYSTTSFTIFSSSTTNQHTQFFWAYRTD